MAKTSHPSIPELDAEIAALYKLLNTEDDFACVMVSHAFIDQCIASLLQKFLIDKSSTAASMLSHRGLLGSYSARCDLAYCLGLIPKGVFQNLEVLGDIRNAFGHS